MKIFKKTSVIFTWFISYVLILFLTIFLNIYAYMEIEKNMFEQNNRYVIEILENKKQNIDNLKLIISNTAVELFLNNYVRKIAFDADEFNENTYDSILEMREQLLNYKSIDFNFEDLYIYFHELDYIVGINSSNNANAYYDVYFKNKNMNKNEWLYLMRENHSGEFVNFSTKEEEAEQGNILYLYSVYGVERFRPYATIAIEINYENIINEQVKKDFERSFYIVDNENKIFLSQKNGNIKKAEELISKHGISDGISYLGNNIMVVVSSAYDGWKYVHIIEKDVFTKNIKYARLALIICNLICISIVLCIAWFLTKKNYKPVRNIISVLETDKDRSMNVDEFQYIKQKITEILNKNKEINQMMKLQDGIIRDAFLIKLLNNESLSEDTDEILKHLNISFKYENFAFVLFYIEASPDMFFDDKNDDEEEAYKLAKLVISNILRDMLNDQYLTFYCDINGMLGCIINMEKAENYTELTKILEKLQQFILKNFNVEIMAGVSNVHKSKNKLHLCYSEAMACMEYRFFGLKDVVQYEDIAQPEISKYYFPTMIEEQLISLLKTGDYQNCIKILNEIFDKNFSDSTKSVVLAKCLLYEVAATMMKAVASTGVEANDDVVSLVNMMSNMGVKGLTLSDIKGRMKEILKSFCEKNIHDNGSRMAGVIKDVKNYIDMNYSDPDLTASVIAEKFNITSPYLSVMFKKHTKIGLLEYITTTRIEQAKRIFDTTDYTVEKVATMVGYTNSRSFFRVFSKYVGVPPGTYKANKLLIKSEDTN